MTPRLQRGMTMWSAAFVIGTIVFFVFLAFKLIPPYSEDFQIESAMKSLAGQPGIASMSKRDLEIAIAKRFDINNITRVDPALIKVEARGKVRYLVLNYEVVVPLAYNISALLEFKHERQVAATE